MQGKKQQLEPDMEQWTASKLRKLNNLGYLTYIQKCRLDESQAGIKIVRRNINNLRYAYETTLMAESERN